MTSPRPKLHWQINAPLATHWRKATCAEIDCPNYLHGWRVRVENCNPQQLHALRTCGRKFQELDLGPGEHWLVFEAGQRCLRASEHVTPNGRPELFVVQGGRTEPRRYDRADQWTDDCATHTTKIVDKIKEG